MTERHPKNPDRTQVADRGGLLEIVVADQGPGFPPAMLGRGAQGFGTWHGGDNGLGLVLVRHFARRLVGELRLANLDPQGAAVTIAAGQPTGGIGRFQDGIPNWVTLNLRARPPAKRYDPSCVGLDTPCNPRSLNVKDTPVVSTILILCGLAFVAELGNSAPLIRWLALWPLGVSSGGAFGTSLFHSWQIVSYAFLHGGVLHLVLNMYALWLFGTPLERRWGPQRIAVFYFACVIGAALLHLAVGEFALSHGTTAYPALGASGGVFGLLVAFGLLYPDVQLLLLFPPVPVKAKWFVIGYAVVELVTGVTGTAAGIAHFAHLGGMLTGYLLLRSGSWFR